MSNKKQLVSSISMLLILFFIMIRQSYRLANIGFMNSTTLSYDILFIIISGLLVVAIAFVIFYIPMLFILNLNFNLRVELSPVINYIQDVQHLNNVFISYNGKRYLRLNVIRC
ncbi:MAG: hypothetical protein KQ78_02229 [Candidatus Izimaplasma bacterium HR2]|nr:MAG: hypothetical protein KQ78_02229 [Candidatus Izimaplasma bacterium HR2]